MNPKPLEGLNHRQCPESLCISCSLIPRRTERSTEPNRPGAALPALQPACRVCELVSVALERGLSQPFMSYSSWWQSHSAKLISLGARAGALHLESRSHPDQNPFNRGDNSHRVSECESAADGPRPRRGLLPPLGDSPSEGLIPSPSSPCID